MNAISMLVLFSFPFLFSIIMGGVRCSANIAFFLFLFFLYRFSSLVNICSWLRFLSEVSRAKALKWQCVEKTVR